MTIESKNAAAKDQLIETWQIHNRINLYLLDAIKEEFLSDALSSKGRNVGAQFAHIHNVRLMWIKAASPDLLNNVKKIEDKEGITRKLLKTALMESAKAIDTMLNNGIDIGRIKGFKPHSTAFLGYLISHESHHRGQIMLCLKQSGHPVDKKIAFGIWERVSLSGDEHCLVRCERPNKRSPVFCFIGLFLNRYSNCQPLPASANRVQPYYLKGLGKFGWTLFFLLKE